MLFQLTAGWAVYSFYPIVVFPVIEGMSLRPTDNPMLITAPAPRWTKGYSVNIAFVFFTWFFFIVGQYLYRKDEKKRELRAIAQTTKDEEDGMNISDKAVGEVVEHIEQRH